MILLNKFSRRKIVLAFALFALQVSFAFGQIKVSVDASAAARNVLHVRETMQVQPGEFTLFYPKWIPGEHAPTGTINEMVNLFVTANGKTLEWRRDDVEMFAFYVTVPAGVTEIEINFDDVSQPGTTASAHLARIKWNRLVLYPRGAKSDDVQVSAVLKMPEGWKFATALPVEREAANVVSFKPVSLTTFVDSPAIIGRYFKRIQLAKNGGVPHEMDFAADSEVALAVKPETLAGWENLITEGNLMFGARHYRSYRFLNTLSDTGGDEGLEHHESSENGAGENALSEPLELLDFSGLLGHEYVHSWNGKYRRPARLATTDFEQPMHADLLWVYEGLTEHLGDVLTARSRLWTPEIYRDVLAEVAANMDSQTGRRWRPLVDTARAVQFTFGAPRTWRNARRGVDYYYEGELIWLEADVLIRQKSGGKVTLDDFLRRFHGVENSAPAVKTYELEDIINTLNAIQPHDWRGFFNERVYAVGNRAPLAGITGGGWKLIFNETPNVQNQINENSQSYHNLMYSIGALVSEDGTILDTNADLPAAKSGLAPGMRITRINEEEFSGAVLRAAITKAKTDKSPIHVVAEYGNASEIYNLNYHGGERYPHLERNATKPDLLSLIIKPRG